MLTTKIRTTVVTIVATGGLAAASALPAISQAQYNNFGYLKSSEAFKLKTQGNEMPCQPTFPVENPGIPTPVGPGGSRTLAGAVAVINAQMEVQSTVGPLEQQTCEADNGTEIAY